MKKKCGIINLQILIAFKEQLKFLIRKRHFSMLMLTKNLLIFNEIILNIIRNFIPHEIVACDDRDPPWMTRVHWSSISNSSVLPTDYELFVDKSLSNITFTDNNIVV